MPAIARNVLSDRVLKVSAAARPLELLDGDRESEASWAAVFDDGRYSGLVSLEDTAIASESQTFSEMLPASRRAVVSETTPLDELGRMFADSGVDCIAVVDEQNAFLGVVTRQSVIEGLLAEGKQVKAELRGQRDLAERQMESVRAIVLLLDAEGRIICFNSCMEELSGYSLREVERKDWFDTFLLQRESEETRERFFSSIADRETQCTVNVIVTKDGSERLIEWHDMMLLDDGGNILALGHDVTDRKQAKEALQENEVQLRVVLEATTNGFWDWDVLSDSVYRSDGIWESLGLEAAAVRPGLEGFIELVHPDDRGLVQSTTERHLEIDEPFLIEHRMKRGDGTYGWYRSAGRALFDQAGRPSRMIGSITDITARRTAEEALRQSEERFRELAENIQEVFWVTNGDREEMLYVSPAFENIWGQPCEELYKNPRSWFEAIVPDDQPRISKVFFDTPHTQICDQEYRIKRPDGSIRWIHDRGFPIHDDSGAVRRIVGIAEDITQRKQAESALQESEARLASAERVAGIGHWDWDVSINNAHLSDECRRIYGLDLQGPDITYEEFLDMVLPDDREQLINDVDEALDKHDHYKYEYRIVRPDGAVRHIHTQVEISRGPDGQPARMFGTVLDVTERKRIEEAQRVSEVRLNAFFNAAPAGLVILDDQFRYLKLNETLAEINGRSIDDHLGKSMHEVVPHIAPMLDSMYRRILLTGDPVLNIEVSGEVQSQPGVTRHWVVSQFRIPGDEPETFAIGVVAIEITERKRAEEQARQLQEQLAYVARLNTMGEMAAGIAHELNQPLTAIATYCYAARETLRNSPSSHAEEFLEKAIDQAIRSGEIIRRMRSLVRKTAPARSSTDVRELIREVVGLVEPEVRLRGTRLKVNVDDTLSDVLADRIQIQQVLINLVRNAFDAMDDVPSDGRTLRITTSTSGPEMVEVAVCDSGTGIAVEDWDRVLDAFFTTKPQGMGMGLAISRSIIESHGGHLWLTPNRERGVTFHFTLPIAKDRSNGNRS